MAQDKLYSFLGQKEIAMFPVTRRPQLKHPRSKKNREIFIKKKSLIYFATSNTFAKFNLNPTNNCQIAHLNKFTKNNKKHLIN